MSTYATTSNTTVTSQPVTYDVSLEVIGTVNILLAFIVAAYAFLRLPRALALLSCNPFIIKTLPTIRRRRLPPHVASCPRLLRSFLTLLRMRVMPGLSVARVIALVIYFFSVTYAGFYRSNIFTDPTRTGWVAISQLPVVFLFAQKNTPLGLILGYGYEKVRVIDIIYSLRLFIPSP